MLGLKTSKFGELEGRDAIRRRIDDAARYASVEQFCLNPQCGFASTEEGNILSEDEQWRKLEMIVELATEVWDGKGCPATFGGVKAASRCSGICSGRLPPDLVPCLGEATALDLTI